MPLDSNALEGSNRWLKSTISPAGLKQQHMMAVEKAAIFMEYDAERAINDDDKKLKFYPDVPKKVWCDAQRRYTAGHQSFFVQAGAGKWLLPTNFMFEQELQPLKSLSEQKEHFQKSATAFMDLCNDPKAACRRLFGEGTTFDELLGWSQDIVVLFPLDEFCTDAYKTQLELRAEIIMACRSKKVPYMYMPRFCLFCSCETFHHRFYCPHSLLFTMAWQDSLNNLNPTLHPKRGRDRCPPKHDIRHHQNDDGTEGTWVPTAVVAQPPEMMEDCYGRCR
jgi:hypothetical protein